MAQLGDVLTSPEAGWKSYSNSEIEALYNKLKNGKDHYYYYSSENMESDNTLFHYQHHQRFGKMMEEPSVIC